MNASTVGSTALAAVQGLQEFMRLNGCEEGLLRPVDTIKIAISTGIPIMEDSGFQSVFEDIRLSTTVELSKQLPREKYL